MLNLVNEYITITGEHVAFVTFNYDLILEGAIQKTLGYRYESINDYVDYENRKVFLFKPHGSCNFIRRLKKEILQHIPSGNTINSVTLLSQLLYTCRINFDIINENLEEEFEFFKWDEILNAADDPNLVMYLPQLLIPFKSKDGFVMPSNHEILLDYSLNEIDEILVIGWKGTEEKFQSLLSKRLGNKKVEITYVTNGDQTIVKELTKSIPNAHFNPDGMTFSKYINDIVSNKKPLFSKK